MPVLDQFELALFNRDVRELQRLKSAVRHISEGKMIAAKDSKSKERAKNLLLLLSKSGIKA